MKGQTITYKIGNALYINVTNRCTNNCIFCIRSTEEGVGYNLWLKQEPQLEDIIKEIPSPSEYEEIVFCGYGEPLMRAGLVFDISRILKQKGARMIRINTNGQANLIHNRDITPEMKGIIDTVSISLNAASEIQYQKLCSPVYGEKAYPGLIDFARLCSKTVKRVILTAVNWPGVDLKACEKIAQDLGLEFRSRNFTGTLKNTQQNKS